ncbi:MAG: hypothetical protein JW940_29685 [Polyangiaceae bacterium]|nr:hypothetical protein [Polyangiaceae bacterium]
MARPQHLGLSWLVMVSACAREPVSLGGDNLDSGQAGANSSVGTGGSSSPDAGRGAGAEAGSQAGANSSVGTGGSSSAEAGHGAGAEAGSESTVECIVGGCSSQLCVGKGEDLVTDCEWLEEYACYRTARCEVQDNGRCGWTQTQELQSCIAAARQGGSGGSAGTGGSPAAGGTGGKTAQTGGTSSATGGHSGVTGGSSGVTGGSGGETDCFSPEQNLDHAYDGTMDGCPCTGSQSICISGVALLCEQGRWSAVEDGPCMPVEVICTGEVETASQCLELFDDCILSDGGGYCGIGATTNQCAAGRIVPSPDRCLDVAAASYCHRLDNGAWCTGLQSGSCPEGWTMMDGTCSADGSWCARTSASQSCQLPLWEMAQCDAAGGTVWTDPGDGSLMKAGCGEGKTELASMNGFLEGGLCCDAGAARRIGIREAAALVAEWAFDENPDLNPTAAFDVLEYDVPDLWETLRVQLFYVDYVSTDGQHFNSALLAYYQGELYPFAATFGGHGLMSGVLQGDAFYYSYSWGSGIHRSVLGRLTIGDAEPEFVESGGFMNIDLFLTLGDTEIQVEQGTYRDYEDWTGAVPFGTLVDRGTELGVIDSEGNEIVPDI